MNALNHYYREYSEAQLPMNKHKFHDSGIVDEGLSDKTCSIDDLNLLKYSSDERKTPKKPTQSYLEIIAEAILQTPNRMMQLYEIYNYFQRKNRYFAEEVNKSWRNSVRHNLSLNDCFVKAGRGTNGKGHYWRIHDLAVKNFEQGRFRCRRRYRQQMQQLEMHPSSFENQPIFSFYSPNAYYECSPTSSYDALYPMSNKSSSTMSHICVMSPKSNNYPFAVPYSSYYPTSYEQHYYPLTWLNSSQNEST